MSPPGTTIVGLTGGIATGKSTVARMLTELGAVVIDADAIVHELQAPGSPVLAEIVEAFGPAALDGSGALDRPALGDRVFRDPKARQQLNAILHPRVRAEMARRVQAAQRAGAPLVVLDIPLLFETRAGSAAGVESVILVYAPRALQIERQMTRDGCDREEAERRIAAQMPIDDKRALADHVIDNSGSREETGAQVSALFERLSQ